MAVFNELRATSSIRHEEARRRCRCLQSGVLIANKAVQDLVKERLVEITILSVGRHLDFAM